MAGQVAKSGLMAKYGNKLDQAVRKHAEDKTDYGFIRLPGGIQNGIAKLVEATFSQYKSGTYTGEYFFRAAGVVVSPKTVITKDGAEMTVEGLQTSIMMPVCETKNAKGEVTSQEENIDKILNEMRKLGGEDFTAGSGGAELEALAAALKEAGPYFKFTTSQSAPTPQYPDPRVWENWHGSKGLEDYEQEDAGGIQDDTTPEPEPVKTTPKATAKTTSKPTPKQLDPEPEPEGGPEYTDQGDLDSLAELAEGGDADAQEKLGDFAKSAGCGDDEVASAPNWAAVVELLKGVGKTADPEPEPEQREIKKGGVFKYAPVDPKTKKPGKAVEVEVMIVNMKTSTVNAKNIDNPKVTYKDVPFASLQDV